MFAVSIQTFFTLDLLSLTHLLVNWEMAVVFFFFFPSTEWWLLLYFLIKTIVLILCASKVMLKILHIWLQQYMHWELPDVQARFRKCRGASDQIANICCLIETASEFQKNIYFCFINYAKTFDYVGHNKPSKILKEMGMPDHLTCLRETCMQVKKQ